MDCMDLERETLLSAIAYRGASALKMGWFKDGLGRGALAAGLDSGLPYKAAISE